MLRRTAVINSRIITQR